jgi:hypothetical protein
MVRVRVRVIRVRVRVRVRVSLVLPPILQIRGPSCPNIHIAKRKMKLIVSIIHFGLLQKWCNRMFTSLNSFEGKFALMSFNLIRVRVRVGVG